MRLAVSCALASLVAALSLTGAPAASAADCIPDVKPCAPAKPSSFAPHPGSQSHVYGAPIQSRILKSPPKKTPHLTSTPLPGA